MVKKKRLLDIGRVLEAVDAKDRNFYDNLTDEERKEFSGFLILKWCATVADPPQWIKDTCDSSFEHERYYLKSTNIHANKHMFSLSKHPKLQWLMLTAVSPDVGKMYHKWISNKKKEKTDNEVFKKLSELYPSMKTDDLIVWSSMISKKDLKELLKKYGED